MKTTSNETEHDLVPILIEQIRTQVAQRATGDTAEEDHDG